MGETGLQIFKDLPHIKTFFSGQGTLPPLETSATPCIVVVFAEFSLNPTARDISRFFVDNWIFPETTPKRIFLSKGEQTSHNTIRSAPATPPQLPHLTVTPSHSYPTPQLSQPHNDPTRSYHPAYTELPRYGKTYTKVMD